MEFGLEWWPYLSWAFAAAVMFYTTTAFATSHMHPDKKAALALWLEGSYESTWTTQFCRMFDGLFGENHFGLRCIFRSAIASGVAVLALWLLFYQILGLISLRADTGLTLIQALVLGAAINILPDYVSLYQTRWLLQQFESVRNPFGQLALLVADAVVTGLIIFTAVKAYLWITGQPQIALIEMAALFSLYAIFFYSTFLTSIWAWAYCASSWFARFSARSQTWLDVSGAPGKTLALLGAAFIFVGSLAIQPFLSLDEEGRTPFDLALCDRFPDTVCQHLARMTEDDQEKLALLAKACEGGATEECLSTGHQVYKIRPKQAVRLWTKSCNVGELISCTNLGVMYRTGIGVEQDFARAVELYRQGCNGGVARSCVNLGIMYLRALGVEQDFARAVELFQQSCDGGNAHGCLNLGVMYHQARGVDQDDARAVELFQQACDWGRATGCTNLGLINEPKNIGRAKQFYAQACKLGHPFSCRRLTHIEDAAE